MNQRAFQDFYPDELSHCYGCGRLNEHGLQIKSYWDGDQTVAIFQPRAYHTGIPGYVYGGLIASIIDCHCVGTASAAAQRSENRNMDQGPSLRFVTASLHVDYLRPTPLGPPLEVRAGVREIKGRKVVVAATLLAAGEVCARGEVIAVQMPEHMMPAGGTAQPDDDQT
jgi:acyl-coenzyme A thioesterase PaaI-like protein